MVMASAGVNMPGGDGNPSAAASSSSTPECRLRRRRRLAPPRAAAAGAEKRVRPAASPPSSSSEEEDESVEGEEGEADAAVAEGDEEGATPPAPGPAQAWPMAFGWLSVAGRSREMEDAVSLRPGFCTWADGSPMHFFGVFDGHGGSHVLVQAGVHAVPGPDARVPGRGARRRGGSLPVAAAGGGGGSSCSCWDDNKLGRGGAGVARGAGADLPARGRAGVPGVRVRPHREPAVPVHAVGQLRHRGLHRRGGRPGPRPRRRRQLRRLPRRALPGARRRPARPALRRPQGNRSLPAVCRCDTRPSHSVAALTRAPGVRARMSKRTGPSMQWQSVDRSQLLGAGQPSLSPGDSGGTWGDVGARRRRGRGGRRRHLPLLLGDGGWAVALLIPVPDRPDELARIEAAGGRVVYINGHRVRGILAMSRALGDRMLRPEVIAEPEITVTDRTPEDQCLILASDGMWDVIPNEIACSVARQCLEDGNPAPVDDVPPAAGGEGAAAAESSEPEARCSRAASLLVRLALGRTTWDNVSVVVIDLKQRE